METTAIRPAISDDLKKKIAFDSQVLLTRVLTLEELSNANTERTDALFESLGELSGMCESIRSSYNNSSNIFLEISKSRFDKDVFYREMNILSGKIDGLFTKLDSLDSKAKDITDDLDDFLGKTRFIEIFEVTRSMISEAKETESRLNMQEKSFTRCDFPKLHANFISLLDSVYRFQKRMDKINADFLMSQKELSSLSRSFASLVTKKDFFEQNKGIVSHYLVVSEKVDLLTRKLAEIKEIPSPSFLFIGQSLHNYVSIMMEKGYRSEYVVDYLASQGVDRSLVKMVVDRISANL